MLSDDVTSFAAFLQSTIFFFYLLLNYAPEPGGVTVNFLLNWKKYFFFRKRLITKAPAGQSFARNWTRMLRTKSSCWHKKKRPVELYFLSHFSIQTVSPVVNFLEHYFKSFRSLFAIIRKSIPLQFIRFWCGRIISEPNDARKAKISLFLCKRHTSIKFRMKFHVKDTTPRLRI